jgi:hypothetical protein
MVITTYFLPHTRKAEQRKKKRKINHITRKPKDTSMHMKKAPKPRNTKEKFASQTQEAERSNPQPLNEGTTKGGE